VESLPPIASWYAFLLIDDDDFEAVYAAHSGPARRFGYFRHFTEDGSRRGVLVVWVDASRKEDAMIKAVEMYAMMRSGSGLEWRDPRLLAVREQDEEVSLHDRLIVEAAELIALGRYELVVLRAQTAAELAAERCYERLIAPRLIPPQRRKAPRLLSRTLADERTRNVFQAITGLRPDAEPWWSMYAEHLRRRNAVVHSGEAVSRTEAEASVSATLCFITYMESDGHADPAEVEAG